jgi:acyl-CoA synthetase (AMP-forming)/AMP-acid ligase II
MPDSGFHVIDPPVAEQLARQAARWLRACGLRLHDRVAVTAINHPHVLALANGALRLGIVPVLLNPYLPREQLAWILQDAEPTLTVDDPTTLLFDRVERIDSAPFPLGRPMFYTSGTTGRPKGVWSDIMPESLARQWAEDEEELWGAQPADTFLVCSPLHHSAGYRAATAALLAGARVLLLERFDPSIVARLMAEQPVTAAFLVPTHLRRILAGDVPPRPRAIRRLLHAGEPCPEGLKRQAMNWLGPGAVWEFYGSTEGQFTLISPEEWLAHPGSVGRARRGRRLEIVHPDPYGVGKIYVSAPPFAGWEYWRDPDRTRSSWLGDAFTVGDLGRIDEDGYLYLVSRREDLIISGGVNVYPAEIERVLLQHPSVQEAAVFGVEDDEWGQRVCAAFVAPGATVEELHEWSHSRLSPPQRPKSLFIVGQLPRTTSGKLDRRSLRALTSA